jgi:hypothetical protein
LTCTNPVTALEVNSFTVSALSCCDAEGTTTFTPVPDVPQGYVASMTLSPFPLPPVIGYIDAPSYIAYPITLSGGAGGTDISIAGTIPPAQQIDQPTPLNTPGGGLVKGEL